MLNIIIYQTALSDSNTKNWVSEFEVSNIEFILIGEERTISWKNLINT